MFNSFDLNTIHGRIIIAVFGTFMIINYFHAHDNAGKNIRKLLKLVLMVATFVLIYLLAKELYSTTIGNTMYIMVAITDACIIVSPLLYFLFFRKHTFQYDNGILQTLNDIWNLVFYPIAILVVGAIVLLIIMLILGEPIIF